MYGALQGTMYRTRFGDLHQAFLLFNWQISRKLHMDGHFRFHLGTFLCAFHTDRNADAWHVPFFAVRIHPQRDRRATCQSTQQQFVRSHALVGAAMFCRFVRYQLQPACGDARGIRSTFQDGGNTSFCFGHGAKVGSKRRSAIDRDNHSIGHSLPTYELANFYASPDQPTTPP